MISLRAVNAHPKYRTNLSATVSLARRVFRREHRLRIDCSIIYIYDGLMKSLNGTYLDHWHATDVLTFPLHDKGARMLSGEIYVNIDQVRRQAREYGVSIREETARLVIHGALHLCGYLDATPAQKKRMTAKQELYVRKFLG
jgi:rRNA maturation RNase YbeY